MALAHGELTPVKNEIVDWVVARDADNILGIRERDVRTAFDAIFADFGDAAQATVKKWMKSQPWTREGLTQVLESRLETGLPVEAVLAELPDCWLLSRKFHLNDKERRVLVDHAMRHLRTSLANDFLEDALTAGRVAQRSEELSSWCNLMGTVTRDLVCYASFLENSVPETLFAVHGDTWSPLGFVGEMAKRPHAIAGSVETALSMAARRLVRVLPPDPLTSWSWLFPTNQVAGGGLAVVTEEPLRTALLHFVDSSVKPENYRALMKSSSNPIKLHRALNNKRLREGSLDTTYRLCQELTRCYDKDPAFDARVVVAIVNAIMEETHAAMLVPNAKAVDFEPAQRVIGNWMSALGIPNTQGVHRLLEMVPNLRQDLHLATVVAITGDSNKRVRQIQDELKRAEEVATRRHEEILSEVMKQNEELKALLSCSGSESSHAPSVKRVLQDIFEFGEHLGPTTVKEVDAALAVRREPEIARLTKYARADLLRSLGAEQGKHRGCHCWKHMQLKSMKNK